MDPKMLECFHSFCRKCLTKLETRDQQGQPILTCPICRHITPVPTSGVAGLQPALHINPFLEILGKQYRASFPSANEVSAESASVDTTQKFYPEKEMKPPKQDSNEIYKAQIEQEVASIEAMMKDTMAEINDFSFNINKGKM